MRKPTLIILFCLLLVGVVWGQTDFTAAIKAGSNVVTSYTGSSQNIAATDYFVECNRGSAITVTLPVSGIAVGKIYVVKELGAGACTINATSGNIDGQSSFVISQLYTSLSFIWDGTQWYVI